MRNAQLILETKGGNILAVECTKLGVVFNFIGAPRQQDDLWTPTRTSFHFSNQEEATTKLHALSRQTVGTSWYWDIGTSVVAMSETKIVDDVSADFMLSIHPQHGGASVIVYSPTPLMGKIQQFIKNYYVDPDQVPSKVLTLIDEAFPRNGVLVNRNEAIDLVARVLVAYQQLVDDKEKEKEAKE